MTSPPLDCTHGRTKSAWHAIFTFWQYKRLNDVGRGMTSPPLDSTHGRQRRVWHDITALGPHTWSDDVGRGMTSLLLDTTHGRTTSGVEFHHSHWVAQNVERRWTWYDMIALGLHARSNNVGRCMTSPPLDNTHGLQRRVWHDITALGPHTWSNDVWLGMPLSPLGRTRSRKTSGVA